MEPTPLRQEEAADNYEPPPQVVARIWRGVSAPFRRTSHARTRWDYALQSLALAAFYAKLSPLLAAHLPPRLNGSSGWLARSQLALYHAAKDDPPRFLWMAAFFGLYTVIAGPLFEELVFRGLPILVGRAVLRRSRSAPAKLAVLAIAALACVLFAWGHFRRLDVFPVPQFLFGLVAFPIAWFRGLRYSVLLHVATNLLFFALQMERILAWAG